MKIIRKLLFVTIAFTAIVSCTEDSFVGEQSQQEANGTEGAISFSSSFLAVTRSSVGAKAAALLNNNFVVEGTKTKDNNVSEVFDNYNVNYTENTAATTTSNTSDWDYVAQSPHPNSGIYGTQPIQSIKHWDFAASQYDFWAYSVGTGSATVTELGPDNSTLNSSAYTITGTKENLEKVYISDLVTAYHSSAALVDYQSHAVPKIGNEVNLTFRSLMAKIRIGLYETIPGYSVKSVEFFPSESGVAAATPTLYATGNVLPVFASTDPYKATVKVYFPHITSSNVTDPDYNVAHVMQTSSDKASNITFSSLTYGPKERKEKTPGDNNWLARSSATPTWAGDGSYSTILPYETGEVMTLKVNYTLESTDDTGETIVVHGATALVPAQYTQWKANYAYTYIFKISDNTNGLTNTVKTDKVGLYPITLDAVAVNNDEGTQETVTTVATPSITTYSLTSDVFTNDKYTTSDDIYVIATEDGSLMSLTGKATLYDITQSSSPYAATEAGVLDALTKYTTLSSGTYTGRNSVVLTPVANALDLTGTTIPTVDGQTIGITAGQAALIDKSVLTTGHYYAFVYLKTAGETAVPHYEAVTVPAGGDVTGLYTTSDGTDTAATVDNSNEQTLYAKYYTVAKAVYGIKVIKIED